MRTLPIYAAQFLSTSGLGVVFVFFEDIQRAQGLSDLDMGIIAGVGFATALVAHLVLSPLGDRGGIATLGLVAVLAGGIGPVGFAFAEGLPLLAFTRGLTGIGFAMFGLVARKALIGLDTQGSGTALGQLLSVGVAGFIMGPLIGAAFEPLGFEAPFLIVGIGFLLVGLPALRTIRHTPIAVAPVDWSDLATLVRRPKVQAAMIVQAIVWGYIGVYDAVLDRWLTDLGASTSQVAWVIVATGAPMLVFPRIAGGMAEARGGAAIILPALALLIPVMAGYGIVTSLILAGLVGALHGLGESFATISAQILTLEVTGAERAAVGSALLEAAGLTAAGVAAFVGPLGYGALDAGVFLATAGVGVLFGLAARIRVTHGWDIGEGAAPEPATT